MGHLEKEKKKGEEGGGGKKGIITPNPFGRERALRKIGPIRDYKRGGERSTILYFQG